MTLTRGFEPSKIKTDVARKNSHKKIKATLIVRIFAKSDNEGQWIELTLPEDKQLYSANSRLKDLTGHMRIRLYTNFLSEGHHLHCNKFHQIKDTWIEVGCTL